MAAVTAATTAAIISSIALRTAPDAQLPSAISSARALSCRRDSPCCRGRRSCPRTGARAPGLSAPRSGCPAPPAAPAPGSPAGAPPPGGWHPPPATGGGRVTDDDAPRLALVLLTCQAHLVPQGELDQVRAPQPGIDLGRGSRQPAAGTVGDQQQKVLGKEHAHTLLSPHRRPDHCQVEPGP